ncbi:MAG: UPF0175 family protein [Anaerolineales bacterium]|nr:UPF0175 family protein [Anaerolineales bacterium]
METAILEIPGDVFYATRMSQDQLKVELALHLFELEKLSFGKARQLAGMNVWQFMQVLGSRNIPVHYDETEYEEDLATLKRMRPL